MINLGRTRRHSGGSVERTKKALESRSSSRALMPFFCFYGGKWRAAPHYPIPLFDLVIEPFAGAAGYATRYAHKRVLLVERDPIIASLWKYLIHVSSSEIRSIPLLEKDQTVDDIDACSDARTLVGFWLNKGSAQPKRSQSSWMRSGIRPKSFWGAEIRERIAVQVEQIRHWSVIEGDYSCAPAIRATWFIDPPYQNPAGLRYKHTLTSADYQTLGDWCRSRRGQPIVCENVGADWLPFQPFKKIKVNESRHGHKVSSEAIWAPQTYEMNYLAPHATFTRPGEEG